jgi:pentatricopeptide repeat protein
MEICFACGDSKESLKIKDCFGRFSIEMTSVSYGILMKGFGNLRNFQKTFEFYEEMK